MSSKLSSQSYFPQDEFIERLKQDFPQVFTEGKIDPAKLQTNLKNIVDLGERYGLSWKGKSSVFNIIQSTTTKTLHPQRAESVNFDETDNLFIEGDNLDALKILQRSYYGKIKMIYIDPPYNTGHDFVYNDSFQENKVEYDLESGKRDEAGNLTAQSALQKNTKDSGHYHSNWLNMMYPRLYLARNLLRDDGVIFVSIDDNEVHNLRLIMNEIFGEENFEGHIHWRRRSNQPNDKTKMIGLVAEHILVYTKNAADYKNSGVGKIGLTGNYSNPDNDPRGEWASKPWKVGKNQSGTKYSITTPTGIIMDSEWMGREDTYTSLLSDNRIYFPDSGNGYPRKKYFKAEREEEGQAATNWWDHKLFGTNQEATENLKTLLWPEPVFSNPKPVSLISALMQIANIDSDDIVLDFFAGSGTTAEALFELNSEYETKNRFILVQIQEELTISENDPSNTKKVVKNAINFLNSLNKPLFVSEIAKERIRRAGKKIGRGDVGFKSFTIGETNLRVWDSTISDPDSLQKQMALMQNPVKDGANEEDLLIELMIKSGIEPTVKRGKVGEFWKIDNNLIICLVQKMTESIWQSILEAKPQKLIFLDSSFAGNDQLKTNLILKAEKEKIEIVVV